MIEIYLHPDDEPKFRSRYKELETDKCWLWAGATIGSTEFARGAFYGKTRDTTVKGKQYHASRYAYTLAYGPIPEGLEVDHLCVQRMCVNPHHLEAVTPAENKRRYAEHMRKTRTHCPRGHEYTPTNLVKHPTQLICLTCSRHRNRARILGITLEEALDREAELNEHFKRPEKAPYVSVLAYKVDWANDPHCRDCAVELYPNYKDKKAGAKIHAGQGRCWRCKNKHAKK